MYRVFKREGFVIYKLIPCLLITIFAFMCLYGSYVYGIDFETTLNNYDVIITIPDYITENDLYFLFYRNRDDIINLLITSKPLIFDNWNTRYDGTKQYRIYPIEDCRCFASSFNKYGDTLNSYNNDISNIPTYSDFLNNSWSQSASDYITSFDVSGSYYNSFIENAYCNFDVYTTNNELLIPLNYIPRTDYTNISKLPDTYYLLTGSRVINNVDTPIHIYCNKFLKEYPYILAYYSYKEYYGYYLDILFSKSPLVLSHGEPSNDTTYISSLYSISSSNNTDFYHLELLSDDFDNTTTSFNITSLELSNCTLYESNSFAYDRERFEPNRIIYRNFPMTINEDDSTDYLSYYDDVGVLYQKNENNEYIPVNIINNPDTFVPKTDVTTDIIGSIDNIDTSFDLSDENVSNFDTSDTGNLITNTFTRITNIFSFTNELLNSFNQIFNFIFNTTPSSTLTVIYRMWQSNSVSDQFPSYLTSLLGNGNYSKYGRTTNPLEGGGLSEHTITLLDLSWYEPYKDTIDLIIAGFMYIAFIWHLVNNAPNIIRGIPSTHDTINSTFNYLDNFPTKMTRKE